MHSRNTLLPALVAALLLGACSGQVAEPSIFASDRPAYSGIEDDGPPSSPWELVRQFQEMCAARAAGAGSTGSGSEGSSSSGSTGGGAIEAGGYEDGAESSGGNPDSPDNLSCSPPASGPFEPVGVTFPPPPGQ